MLNPLQLDSGRSCMDEQGVGKGQDTKTHSHPLEYVFIAELAQALTWLLSLSPSRQCKNHPSSGVLSTQATWHGCGCGLKPRCW